MNKKNSMLKVVVAFVVALMFVLPGSAVFVNFGTTMNEDNDSSNSNMARTSSGIVSVNNNIDMRTFDDDIDETPEVLADGVDWWPMFQHDLGNTGYSTSTAPDTNDVLWSYDPPEGGVSGSPAVVDGKVYVGGSEGVYCLDAVYGSLIWSSATARSVYGTPAVADGKVYVGSYSYGGNVYCLDAQDGSIIWKYMTSQGIISSPTVSDGKVYVGSENGNYYCLDAQHGSYVWSYDVGAPARFAPAVVDGKVYVNSNAHSQVYCLNAENGSVIWNYTIYGSPQSAPAVVDGKVFAGGSGGILYCLDAVDGSLIWRYVTDLSHQGVYKGPTVAYGKVFFGTYDCLYENGARVYCLNESDGSQIWNYTVVDNKCHRMTSSPTVADGKVFIGDMNKEFYCMNESDGSIIWRYITQSTSHGSAVANGRLYVGAGKLYCFGQPPPNYPPYEPSNPDPEDGETDVPIDAELSWTGGDPSPHDLVSYDIYFGTSSPPPQVVSGQYKTSYEPEAMLYNTQYYWKIVSWDNHGLSNESLIWSFTTIPDTIPPFITGIQANPSPQMPDGCVDISAVVTDNVEVDMVYLYILYPDSSVENFSITQNKTGDTYFCNKAYDQLGVHTFHIWANDTSGNVAVSADHDFEITLDTTPPVTTHEFDLSVPDGENGWYVSDVTITLDATDDLSGVAVTYYRLDDGEDWETYTSLVEVSDDGEYVLEYYSVDNAGNIEGVNGPFEFNIDQTSPTITLTAEKIGLTTKWLLTATVSDVTSGVARVKFYLDGVLLGTVTEEPYEWECSGTDGHMATATVYDDAGHLKESNEVESYRYSNIIFFLERFMQRFPIFAFILDVLFFMR